MIPPRNLRIATVACGAGAFAIACLIPFVLQAGGVKLGPDMPLRFAQDKGKSGDGGKGGDPPGPPITPPGQNGTPPGQQKNGAAPAVPTDHESGVHGAAGRDSGAFGTPSGLRGTREVPEGR
ncbi:MAG: hypothetical protein A3G73_06185 [Rhodospirillales bacterium RIFCSPLOWO2_12_FULL_67_15]|nr:MAG: hypothetical protein A3G73_06185 [Rhodospirillales bacterium RIFCSPLOWO2_12_FULL_67_15]